MRLPVREPLYQRVCVDCFARSFRKQNALKTLGAMRLKSFGSAIRIRNSLDEFERDLVGGES
jgi:hypothetical protein